MFADVRTVLNIPSNVFHRASNNVGIRSDQFTNKIVEYFMSPVEPFSSAESAFLELNSLRGATMNKDQANGKESI